LPYMNQGIPQMTKEQQAATDLKARLYARAASLGVAMKAEAEIDAKAKDSAVEAAGHAKDRATDATRLIMGFSTPMFRGLADLGPMWASAFNDGDSPDAVETAKGMADSFMGSFTKATDKTKAGGTGAGYVALIRCGSSAPTIHQRLANRLEHWQAIADSVKDDNTEAGKATRETAKRYTITPGDSLRADGSWPTKKDKDGNEIPTMPKYNGRAEGIYNGIPLPHRGGCDRKAMLAALANLYREHGDSALHNDVLDAMLDNGGKYVMPPDESAKGLAGAALSAVEKVLLAVSGSADAALLQVCAEMLARIAKDGPKDSATAPTIPTESEESEDSADTQTDAQTDAQTAPDSEATTEGEPVALGKPTGKRARAKKQGGGL
jgi:hypothetical protein